MFRSSAARLSTVRQSTIDRAPSRRFLTAFLLAASLFSAVPLVGPAHAGAYSADANPTLPEVCHDFHVAVLSVATANQSAPNIAKALRLADSANRGCQTNPRESIRKLEMALHLVTPL